MKALFSFIAVLLLVLIAYTGVTVLNAQYVFGIVMPYLAVLLFIGGLIYRILKWGSSPVPFRIPTTCGQQKSLPWIKQSKLENPSGMLGVLGRMALEVFFFRSLFRNLKTQLNDGPRLTYGEAKWLWLAGMAFHYSFLVILIRHLRFFMIPVPEAIQTIAALDSFPLFLILAIATSGVLMRYFTKTDIVSVKMLTMGLVSFSPAVPPTGIGSVFYIHLFLLCVLFAYFPFSKLVHMAGVFMSPTRNLANNNRAKRHINPWNYPVHVHTYAEYEDEFRDKMKKAGLPVEKE
jgi:nitrate reductase gamma subunit